MHYSSVYSWSKTYGLREIYVYIATLFEFIIVSVFDPNDQIRIGKCSSLWPNLLNTLVYANISVDSRYIKHLL